MNKHTDMGGGLCLFVFSHAVTVEGTKTCKNSWTTLYNGINSSIQQNKEVHHFLKLVKSSKKYTWAAFTTTSIPTSFRENNEGENSFWLN